MEKECCCCTHKTKERSEAEYRSLVDYAVELGATQAFVQEGESASESFIPDFRP